MKLGVALVLLLASSSGCSGCKRSARERPDAGVAPPAATVAPAPSASDDAGGARPGMAWIPAGTLRAGTPPGRTPRVPDEEMPGAPVEMDGFYIDLLPWPNEPNAIPTTNVARDEAEQHCATKGKRLCTELEWERACKGPDGTTYEYGDAYRKDVCGTGVALEQASRRPSGEHAHCKSGFGVQEMHGGPWEWTSSAWGRGSKDAEQGVLRGGNSVAGELVGRCSNAIARAPSKRSTTMGFRCCAGPRNAAEVSIDRVGTPGVTLAAPSLGAPWTSAVGAAIEDGTASIDPKSLHAYTWIPVANEKLVIVTGCTGVPRSCGLVVGRSALDAGAAGEVLASVATGKGPAEIVRGGSARHLKARSLEPRGLVSRDLTYAYGRVELGAPKRP